MLRLVQFKDVVVSLEIPSYFFDKDETQSSYHINIVYKVFVNDSCQ